LFSDIKQTLQNLLHALNKQQNFSIIGEHGTIYFQVVEKQSRVIFHPSKKTKSYLFSIFDTGLISFSSVVFSFYFPSVFTIFIFG
jgi:hypothetical protein